MNLRAKVLLVLGVATLLTVAATYAAGSRFLMEGFERVEQRDARLNVERAREAMLGATSSLSMRLTDWAAWDDSYRFVQDRNPEYVEVNLSTRTMVDLRVNALVFVDTGGRVLETRGCDFDAGTPAEAPRSLLDRLAPGSMLLSHPDVDHSIEGYLMLPEGPAMVASRPITSSRHDAPPRGTLVWLQWLGKARVREAAEATHLDLDVRPIDGPLPDEVWSGAASALRDAAPESIEVRPLTEDSLAGFAALRDLDGRPALLMRVGLARDITRQGRASVRALLLALVVAGALFAAAMIGVFELLVLARVVRMGRTVGRIGRDSDFGARLPVDSADELGRLAGDVNGMLSALAAGTHAIQESEQRFQMLANSAPVMIWLSDASGSTTYLSDPWVKLTGRPREAGLGFGWLDDVHPDDLERVRDDVRRAVGARTAFRSEFRVRRADGEWRWIAAYGVTREANGAFAGHVGSAMDVTERVRMVRDLVAAREEAESASRMKSEFLANMSHEIRTPLNGILGLSALALKAPLPDAQRELVEGILSSGRGLLAVLNDILDLSRIEAGRLAIERIPFRLRDALEATLVPLRPLVEGKGLELRLFLEDAPEAVFGDPARVGQVLTNLVGNAAKFTERGSVEVRVSGAKGREGVRFSVKDTGAGIPPGQRAKIFDAFTQGDASTSRRFGGSGLGLTISSQLVGLMGGRLGLDSQVGRGSEFFFELPLPTADPASVPAPGGEAAPGPAPARPLSVLLVEDNAVNRLVAERMLRGLGHAVACASDGEEALGLLGGGRFDIVLMDVQMPGTDGLETTRRWRRSEAERGLARTPIVALTAHAMKGDEERCRAAGMDGYLVKPLDESALRAQLSLHAPLGPAAGPAGRPPPLPGPAATRTAVDFGRLRERIRDDQVRREVVDVFLREAPSYLEELRLAVESGDAAGIESSAHRLKGTLRQLSADRAASAAAALEELGRSRRPDGAAEVFGSFREELARALEELRGVAETP